MHRLLLHRAGQWICHQTSSGDPVRPCNGWVSRSTWLPRHGTRPETHGLGRARKPENKERWDQSSTQTTDSASEHATTTTNDDDNTHISATDTRSSRSGRDHVARTYCETYEEADGGSRPYRCSSAPPPIQWHCCDATTIKRLDPTLSHQHHRGTTSASSRRRTRSHASGWTRCATMNVPCGNIHPPPFAA